MLDRQGSLPRSKLKKPRNRCGAVVPILNVLHFCTGLCHNQIGTRRQLCHTTCRKIPGPPSPLAPRHARFCVTTPKIRDGCHSPPDIQCRMSRRKRSHCSSLNHASYILAAGAMKIPFVLRCTQLSSLHAAASMEWIPYARVGESVAILTAAFVALPVNRSRPWAPT